MNIPLWLQVSTLLAQWYSIAFAPKRSLDRILLGPKSFFLKFWLTFGVVSSNPGQNWHFFNSLQQSWDHFILIQIIKLYLPYKGQVPQSTGNRSKIDFCILLLSSETFKVDFLQNSSLKLQNINLRVYPYPLRPNATLKSLQEFH